MRLASLLVLSALAALPVAAHAEGYVGYYGRTTAPALIYGAPSAKSRIRLRVAAGTGMVLRPAGKSWQGVIMSDGRVAYVPSQTVEIPNDPQTGERHWFTATQVAGFFHLRTRRSTEGYVASRSGVPRTGLTAGESMAANAESLEGTTPHLWGGTQLGAGIDCSGFVQKMAGRIGLALPRTAAEQSQVGMKITRYEDLRPGDRLYFWDAKRGKIGHTGIYVGGGFFTHSSSGHHGIARDYLGERWRRICVDARR